jgi:hypothetical protein
MERILSGAPEIFGLEVIAEGLNKFPEKVFVREVCPGALGQVQVNVGAEGLGKVRGGSPRVPLAELGPVVGAGEFCRRHNRAAIHPRLADAPMPASRGRVIKASQGKAERTRGREREEEEEEEGGASSGCRSADKAGLDGRESLGGGWHREPPPRPRPRHRSPTCQGAHPSLPPLSGKTMATLGCFPKGITSADHCTAHFLPSSARKRAPLPTTSPAKQVGWLL